MKCWSEIKCVCVCVCVCQCVSVCVCVEYYRAQSLLSCSSFQIEMLQDYAIKWGPCTRTQVRVGSWPPIQVGSWPRIRVGSWPRIRVGSWPRIRVGSRIPIWVLSWSALDLSYHWSRSESYHDRPWICPIIDPDPIVTPPTRVGIPIMIPIMIGIR